MSFKLSEFTAFTPRDSKPKRARYTNGEEVRTGWVVNTFEPEPGLTRHLFVEQLNPTNAQTWVATPEQIVFL